MRLTGGTASGPVSYQPTMINTFTTNTNIPNDYTKVAYRDSSTISQTEDPAAAGSYFTTTYKAHISTTQPAGIYNGQVQYVMVHPSGAEAPKVPTMQDATSIKAKLTNIGDTMQAVDSRDSKQYTITKLADGKIWMTENLNLTGGTEITSELYDVPDGYTLPISNGFQAGNKLPFSSTSGFDDNTTKPLSTIVARPKQIATPLAAILTILGPPPQLAPA